MRLTINEAVNILKDKHSSFTQIALSIGATRRQLEYAIQTEKMKYELKKKLVRKPIKYQEENGSTSLNSLK